MADMTFETLASYSVGTVLECGSLLPAVTKENLVCQILRTDPEKGNVKVQCFFFDIQVATLIGRRTQAGGIAWVTVTKDAFK